MTNNSKCTIPVTVFSGFLAAGNTTLLNHLLHNGQGIRVAIIVRSILSKIITTKRLLIPSKTKPFA